MKVSLPSGSPSHARTEAQDFTQQVAKAGLDAIISDLIYDDKMNCFSVEFSREATQAQKNSVHAILKNSVTQCEIDGVIDSRAPEPEPEPEEEDYFDDEAFCLSCRGTRLNAEGDVCIDCHSPASEKKIRAFGPKLPNGLTHGEWERVCEERERYLQPAPERSPKLIVKRKQFLSGNETAFLARLKLWFPEVDIHCQVQLMRLVEIDKHQIEADLIDTFSELAARAGCAFTPPTAKEIQSARWRQHNLFNLLSCDFVLADRLGVPLCVIELDGEEHGYDATVHQEAVKHEQVPADARSGAGAKAVERVKGWGRDVIKHLALRTVGIPLLRVQNDDIYHPQGLVMVEQQIRDMLANVLSGK